MDTKRLLTLILISFIMSEFNEANSSPHVLDYDDLDSAQQAWSYFGKIGVSDWSALFPNCDGKTTLQSPIAIDSGLVEYSRDLSELVFTVPGNDGGRERQFYILNEGHTAKLLIDEDILLTGSNLTDVYVINSLHFHWGSNDTVGSEHTINGQRYPLEMHIIFVDGVKYSSIDYAIESSDDDGLAVLAVLYQISPNDNPVLAPILNALENIVNQNASNKVPVPLFNVLSLLPQNTRNYYRYDGSLTTPPCNEVAKWTIFQEVVQISSNQMAKFRSLYWLLNGTEVPMEDNWRPLQPDSGRKVYSSFILSGTGFMTQGAKIYRTNDFLPFQLTMLFCACAYIFNYIFKYLNVL